MESLTAGRSKSRSKREERRTRALRQSHHTGSRPPTGERHEAARRVTKSIKGETQKRRERGSSCRGKKDPADPLRHVQLHLAVKKKRTKNPGTKDNSHGSGTNNRSRSREERHQKLDEE